MSASLRPPVPYYGGKITVAPEIARLLPPHRHYVEPFAGSLAVLFAKEPAVHETVNDLDGALVNFWQVLRDQPTELARACALTPHARAEFDAALAFEDTTVDPVERARRVFVRLTQGRGGTLRKVGWRRYVVPSGGMGMPGYLERYVDRMAPAVERLAGVSIECRPALEVIRDFGAHPDVLLYVDPPYLATTRGYGNQYREELRTETEHRQLAETLRSCAAAVVLSGYASDLYDRELYAGWDRHTIASSTGMADVPSARTEVLWSNRPLCLIPTLFDDSEVLGAR